MFIYSVHFLFLREVPCNRVFDTHIRGGIVFVEDIKSAVSETIEVGKTVS